MTQKQSSRRRLIFSFQFCLLFIEGMAVTTTKREKTKRRLAAVLGDIRSAGLEPDMLRIIGEESKQNGTDALTSREIDRLVKSTRTRRKRVTGNLASAGNVE